MKAIIQDRYGSPDAVLRLRDVDMPVAGEDEVLVRVYAASVHPDVWHVVTGRPIVARLIGLLKPTTPIPGTDMAGVVESVGGGVTWFEPGDAVFGETFTEQVWRNGGAYAEYVSVNQDLLARKPDNVSFEQAAAVPTSGYIVLNNLRDGSQVGPGKKVLVNGAGGGVGSLALQFAKAHGAHVTAVDAAAKLDLLRSLGADEVIDYTEEDFTRRGTRYDLIFDIPGNHPFSACKRALEPGGRYVLIGHESFGGSGSRVFGILPRFFGLMFLALFAQQLRGPKAPMPTKHDAVEVWRELLESGKITPIIDSTYRLSEVREAFRRMIEGEPRGRVIVVCHS